MVMLSWLAIDIGQGGSRSPGPSGHPWAIASNAALVRLPGVIVAEPAEPTASRSASSWSCGQET